MLGLEVRRFARGDFLGRRNDDHVAVLAHVETLGGHDDIERLVPWNVPESQGDVTLDRIRDHDVASGRLGQQLQHGARLDVLEVQRQALAFVLLGLRE